jgi:23S rRNA pseudouridine2605 synthase
VPKKTEKKAVAATASAGKKKAATLEIELISAPEPKPKAIKTPVKKADVASKPPAKAKKAAVKLAPEPPAVSNEAALNPASPPAKRKQAITKASAAKTAKVTIKGKTGRAVKVSVQVGAPVADPIGDMSDGEAHTAGGANVSPALSESESLDTALAEEIKSNEEPEYIPEAPPVKLERLQKILAKAGIASRRRAEEMIVEGRVMVNGQLVTQLGAKADLGRDHIRVDGKLIAEAERHRYFVLNKPRGFVTTVSDPEHRPTVMQFFETLNERLYPVGRLDYLSEGLLLVTNDGDLANQLTRASLGVEKTYLVKVAGKPTEEELDRLRSGVSIEREGPGSKRVGTAPASIRQVRQGDNPWYEVVLIEGRNRELRKMFEQIGHFVEKIRRVGYGPLVLDVEPGRFRELSAEEVKSLQLTAVGKLKPRRQRALPTVPKETARPAGDRAARSGSGRTFGSIPGRAPAGRSGRPFDGMPRERRPESRPAFDSRGAKPAFKPSFKPRFDSRGTERFGGRSQIPNSSGKQRSEPRPFEPRRDSPKPYRGREEFDSGRAQRFEGSNTGFRPQQRNQDSDGAGLVRREFGPRGDRPEFRRGGKPEFKRSDRPAFEPRGKSDFNRGGKTASSRRDKPVFKRSGPGAPLRGGQSGFRSERPAFERGGKPPFNSGERPAFKRSAPGAPLREDQSGFRSGGPAFDRHSKPTFDRGPKPPFKRDDRPPFRRSGDAGGSFEARPSRPPGRTFGSRPAGKPGGRPLSGKFSGGASSGRKFSSGAPRKSGSRPGGKIKPRWDRKHP